jgi:hypothetical protein
MNESEGKKTAIRRYLINTGVEKSTKFKYRLEFWPPDVSK